MAVTSRDGSYSISKAMVTDLIANFDHTKVDGLSENPIFTLTVTPRTPEPYVYFYETDSEEVWKSKDSESRTHSIVAQVMVKNEVGRGNSRQRDEITNQVLQYLTDEDNLPIPQDTGFIIQNIVTGSITKYESVERGARYFIANIPIEVTAYYAGFSIDIQPQAGQRLTYTGFEDTITNHRLETWDDGSATALSTYPNSNGWTVTGVTVAKQDGKTDGTLTGNTLSILDTDTSLGLTSTIAWAAVDDATETTSTTSTTSISRIKSLRFGSLASASQPSFSDNDDTLTGLRNLPQWNTGGRVRRYGAVSPVNEVIEITTNAGEWIYIVMDAAEPALTEVREEVANQDILADVFESPIVTGGYRIYMAKKASNFDNTDYTYTLK